MQMPQEPADRRKRISRDEIRATIAAEIGSPVDGIADDDDLIRMGLNSIRMMALAGRWRMGGARITFAELAAHPTVASWHELLSDEIAGIADPSGDRPPETVAAGSEHDPYPLAAMQHAYWIGRCEEQELGGVAAHLYVEFDGPRSIPCGCRRGDRSRRCASDATYPIPSRTAGSRPCRNPADPCSGRRSAWTVA